MSGGPRTYKAPPTFLTPNNPSFAPYLAGQEWDQSAWFQALTRIRGPPGGKNTYDEPRPRGFHQDTNTNDHTSFVYGQAEVTEHHWPDVMYLLRPPPEREAYLTKAAPGQLHDGRGIPMVEKWPIHGRQARPLKELAGLPNCISSNETWDRIEFWRRLNPRILMEDILMRMHPDVLPRTTVGDTRLRNSLNMRASRRAYPEYCLISWFGKGLDGGRLKHTARDETLQKLTPQQIAANTTRGSTPGLVNPLVGERPGNRIELPSVCNASLTRRCGGRAAASHPARARAPRAPMVRRTKAGERRKRAREESEEDEESGEEEVKPVTKVSRKKARKGGERTAVQRVDILVDARARIGTFKSSLGIDGHPRQPSRGSMPPGTFTGPPNALVSRRNREETLSPEMGEAPIVTEDVLDPALLEPNGMASHYDRLQSPEYAEYSPQVSGYSVPQFEDHAFNNIPSPPLPVTPYRAPYPPPPGTCDPRTLSTSRYVDPLGNSPGQVPISDPWQDATQYDLQNIIQENNDPFMTSLNNYAGFNRAGFTYPGLNRAGFNHAGYNPAGFNPAGFNPAGFNPAGLDYYPDFSP